MCVEGGGGRNSSGSRPSDNGGLGHPHPEIRGGGAVGARPQKNIFWPWSKNKRPVRTPSVDPPLGKVRKVSLLTNSSIFEWYRLSASVFFFVLPNLLLNPLLSLFLPFATTFASFLNENALY